MKISSFAVFISHLRALLGALLWSGETIIWSSAFQHRGSMFCQKCGTLLRMEDRGWCCPMCGSVQPKVKAERVIVPSRSREIALLEDAGPTRPKTRAECPKCGHNEAYWVIRQTRAADEPETRIYRCTKCSHTWREY
ncbi:MAG: transcription factor S [Candidatus Thermoplasmatota archaeon]